MQETSEDSAFEWYMDLTYYNHFNGMDGVTVNVTQKKNRVQMKWNIENNNPTILKEWPIYKTLDGFIKGLEDNGYVCKG